MPGKASFIRWGLSLVIYLLGLTVGLALNNQVQIIERFPPGSRTLVWAPIFVLIGGVLVLSPICLANLLCKALGLPWIGSEEVGKRTSQK